MHVKSSCPAGQQEPRSRGAIRAGQIFAGAIQALICKNRIKNAATTSDGVDTNFWDDFGYEVVGPVYFYFLQWLCYQAEQDGGQASASFVRVMAFPCYAVSRSYGTSEENPIGDSLLLCLTPAVQPGDDARNQTSRSRFLINAQPWPKTSRLCRAAGFRPDDARDHLDSIGFYIFGPAACAFRGIPDVSIDSSHRLQAEKMAGYMPSRIFDEG